MEQGRIEDKHPKSPKESSDHWEDWIREPIFAVTTENREQKYKNRLKAAVWRKARVKAIKESEGIAGNYWKNPEEGSKL